MKNFNLRSYQHWFNRNYSWAEMSDEEREALPDDQNDFRLDGGWFPEDGEYGMYIQGCEIAQLVFEEGLDIHDDEVQEMIDTKFPDLINPDDLSIATKSVFNETCLFLPFEEKYIPIFEFIATDFTGIKPKISLEDYLKED